MVLYILVVAILNLSLGFAVAAYLGKRRSRLPAIDEFPTLPTPPIQPGPPPASAPPRSIVDQPSPAMDASPAASPPVAAAEESSEREKSPSEVSVLEFQDEVRHYHDLLASFDDRLRSFEQSPEQEEVSSYLTSLRQANEEYLESRDRVCGIFEQLHRERQEFGQVRNHMEAAIERQSEQITRTNEAIDGFDLGADLNESCRQLANETSKLLDVNAHLRDTLDEALVAVARNERWLGAAEEVQRTDPLTGLANRTGLEAALAQWWENDPRRTKSLTAAMLDIDQFTRVNQQFGHKVGDRILCAVAQLLTAESRSYLVASRYTGQRFFLLFGDVDVRFTTNLVERIRQTVELAHLKCGEDEIRLTVSCAVTEAHPNDTSATLCSRAEETLQEAKRYGRNRTFLHEGKYPTPVVPPNFSIEERLITV